MQENNNGWLGVIIVLIILYFFGYLGKVKYEGQNAEYWYNAYDEQNGLYEDLHACVEYYYEVPDDVYYNCL